MLRIKFFPLNIRFLGYLSKKYLVGKQKLFIFAPLKMRNHLTGGMAEWSIAAVLKTVDCNRSGGSNPSLSATSEESRKKRDFFMQLILADFSFRFISVSFQNYLIFLPYKRIH